jgi:hypothetical protein
MSAIQSKVYAIFFVFSIMVAEQPYFASEFNAIPLQDGSIE